MISLHFSLWSCYPTASNSQSLGIENSTSGAKGLLARCLYKPLQAIPSKKDLLVKIAAQDLLDFKNEHRATARAMRQAQSAERVAPAMSSPRAR